MSISQPLWLQSEDVRQLLNMLVDRLDSADLRGTRVQSVALGPKNWPALYGAQLESNKEALWEHVGELVRWGWIGCRPEAAALARSGYDYSPRVLVLDETAIRAAVGRTERVRSASERWRQAVHEGLQATDKVKRMVSEFCIDLADRSMTEVVARLNELPALMGEPLLLREVSSKLFWGLSKVLDKRQGLVAALLEVDECPFPEAPIQLQVHLPKGETDGVLFIENLTTFDRAIRSEASVFTGLVLVFASGFKGSAQRLRTPAGCSLYFSDRGEDGVGARQRFKAWLFDKGSEPAYFWGDLDWAGMRIVQAMRCSFEGIEAWEPGYKSMLRCLDDGNGHAPETAEKQGQKPIERTGSRYADETLLPALRRSGRFVDQELVAL